MPQSALLPCRRAPLLSLLLSPLLAPLLALLLLRAPPLAAAGQPIPPSKVDVVAATACANGQAQRPCTAMERVSGGRSSSSTCPCPYIDGVIGGPGPVRRFTLAVQNLVVPSLVPGLDKV